LAARGRGRGLGGTGVMLQVNRGKREGVKWGKTCAWGWGRLAWSKVAKGKKKKRRERPAQAFISRGPSGRA